MNSKNSMSRLSHLYNNKNDGRFSRMQSNRFSNDGKNSDNTSNNQPKVEAQTPAFKPEKGLNSNKNSQINETKKIDDDKNNKHNSNDYDHYKNEKKELFVSDSYNDASRLTPLKKDDNVYNQPRVEITPDISVAKPVAEHIFSKMDQVTHDRNDQNDMTSFALRIAKTRKTIDQSQVKSKLENIDFSKSLIEKKEYLIDNDDHSLTNQEELLKKKLENLKRIHQNLRRENVDLKTELVEEHVSRRVIDKELDLVQRKLKALKIKDDSFKKAKAQERLLILEKNIKEVKTSDSHSLFSKLISMNRKHTNEVRTMYQELEKTKEFNDLEKSKLKSLRVVELSRL